VAEQVDFTVEDVGQSVRLAVQFEDKDDAVALVG